MPCYHVTLRFLCLTSGVADGILFGTTERGCETHQLSQSVGNNTLRNGLCRHVGTGLVGPNSVLGQWRSQKLSTGVRRSVAFLSVHSRSRALPSRPYNQKTSWHTAWKKLCIFLTGGAYAAYVTCMATPLSWVRSVLKSQSVWPAVCGRLCLSRSAVLRVATTATLSATSRPVGHDAVCRRRRSQANNRLAKGSFCETSIGNYILRIQ